MWQIAAAMLDKNNSPAWNKLKTAINLANMANSAKQQEEKSQTIGETA